MIYEYECPKCGQFEQRQSMEDDALASCPHCGSSVHKIMSSFQILLTGDEKWRRRKGTVVIPEKDW